MSCIASFFRLSSSIPIPLSPIPLTSLLPPPLHSPPLLSHCSQRLAPLSKNTLTLSLSSDPDVMDLSDHGSTNSRDSGNIGGHVRKGSHLSVMKIGGSGGSGGEYPSPAYSTVPTTATSIYSSSNSVTAAAILLANDDHMVGRGKERQTKGMGQGRGEKGEGKGVYRRNSHNKGSSVCHTTSNSTSSATPTSPIDFNSTTSSDGE